jgi:hypothetical protein
MTRLRQGVSVLWFKSLPLSLSLKSARGIWISLPPLHQREQEKERKSESEGSPIGQYPLAFRPGSP